MIIPFSGQSGLGGNPPDYFEQGNCDILPNKSGILIQKDVFLDLIDQTTIWSDFSKFFIFINPDQTKNQKRYHINYNLEANISADFTLIKD